MYPIIERARILEELRKEIIRRRIEDLETSVKSCSPKSLRQAYILGKEETTIEDARKIGILVAQFELDCGCSMKP